jgi:predicted DNA-binding transcriptional regulator AlpA
MTALSMEATAQLVGLSVERFRKVWKGWAQTMAFPAPFRGGVGRASYAWDREDVEAWKAARKRALGCHAPQPGEGAEGAFTSSGIAASRRLANERLALRRIRESA